ncbi:MAG: CBS domain-containing protein [Anaerolineae bacterium]|nr:CBS domain-containing protein [Anaerolineae bacterium]MBN8617671.1 CBS domain-containing protein [Anaerolineae bacterium]
MNVSDIMTAKPSTVRLHSTLREALDIMERIGCHHLPVLSNENHLIGIISDRDCRTALNSPYIMRERWQDEELVNHLQVRMIMTPAPIVIPPDARAEDAARLMVENQISSLPVMKDETLVGIVTRSDIVMAFIRLAESSLEDHNPPIQPHQPSGR